MSKEMREQINKFLNWKKLFNETSEEVEKILNEHGFSVHNIYDVEKINGIVSSMKLNNIMPIYLYEGIDFELENPGGMIIFSTDLNSTLANAETFIDKVKFFFESKWKTYLNRLNVPKRLKKILLDKYKQPGYTLGKKFRGAYKGKNGITFNEKSFTIDIAGIDSDILILIASQICREFKQESVMVRDFNKTKVYFVNDEE